MSSASSPQRLPLHAPSQPSARLKSKLELDASLFVGHRKLQTAPERRAGSVAHLPSPAARRYRTRGKSRGAFWDTLD